MLFFSKFRPHCSRDFTFSPILWKFTGCALLMHRTEPKKMCWKFSLKPVFIVLEKPYFLILLPPPPAPPPPNKLCLKHYFSPHQLSTSKQNLAIQDTKFASNCVLQKLKIEDGRGRGVNCGENFYNTCSLKIAPKYNLL